MGTWKLLVEGQDDQEFFSAFCESIVGEEKVEVFPPKTLDSSSGNGWGNLINNLPLLLGQLEDKSTEKLGIILDADHPPRDSGGFTERYKKITDKLAEVGYSIPNTPSFLNGDIFTHSDGLPNIGLWIMPNHQNNGMLENFVEEIIAFDVQQQKILAHADQSISNLPITLFDQSLHTAKAKIYTWRAWQKKPGKSLRWALDQGILDKNAVPAFCNWLENVFK